MSAINITGVVNATSYPQLLLGANNLSDGYLGMALIVGFFMISFVAMKGRSFRDAVVGSTFITFIVSMLMWVLGIVPEFFMYVMLGITVIGIFLLNVKENY
jgi:hypothetical protein